MANHTNQHKPWLLFNNQSPENTPPHSHTQTHRPGLKGKDITTSPTVLIRSIYNTRVHKHLVWKATKLRVVFLHKILNSNALDETLLIQICRSMRSESTSEEILWIGIRCSFTHSCTHMPALSLSHREVAAHLHDLTGCSWEAKQRSSVHTHTCVYSPIDPAVAVLVQLHTSFEISFRNLERNSETQPKTGLRIYKQTKYIWEKIPVSVQSQIVSNECFTETDRLMYFTHPPKEKLKT